MILADDNWPPVVSLGLRLMFERPELPGYQNNELANMSFSGGHVQIYSKFYLLEIPHSVLKLQEIFSVKPLQETSKNCIEITTKFLACL